MEKMMVFILSGFILTISTILLWKGKRKKTIFFSAVGLSLLIFVTPAVQSKETMPTKELEQKISFIYAVLDKGNVNQARQMLQAEMSTYVPEYALLGARIALQNKDMDLAKLLYQKALHYYPNLAEEASFARIEEAEQAYLEAEPQNAAEHQQEIAEKTEAKIEAVAKEIKGAITDQELYHRAAKLIFFAEEAYEKYLQNGELDAEEVKKQMKRMEKFFSEFPDFLKNEGMRMARLKLQILAEDYKAIAKAVSEDSGYHELLIVSELYLNRYVGQKDFSGDFSGKQKKQYEMVYDRLNRIFSEKFDNKSREERKVAKEQLSSLRKIIKNPALGKITDGLLRYADEDYALDASKVYLQMAKIEHSLGNASKSSEYLDKSMDTVGDCEDSNYTVPMYELVGIITEKDNPERLKEVAEYVDAVLENNMTLQMKEEVLTPNPIAETDSPESSAQNGREENREDSLKGDFSTQMQTYVSQKRMSINIVGVDTSEFALSDTILAKVNINHNLYSNAEELKRALTVSDCGIDIEDFEVKKVEYRGAKILLCVDTSGSMEGEKIETLKQAVELFTQEKSEIEQNALVTFSDHIEGDYPFGLSAEEMRSAAQSIYADGGTAIFNSLIYSIEKFEEEEGVIQSIIVMTDGRDGYNAYAEDIENKIGIPCREKGITVYTIGFGGDADISYLNDIATATGGKFLYAGDPTSGTRTNQLDEFFTGLRSQILNQYEISFRAKDTLTSTRELKISVGQGLDSDHVTYYLSGGKDALTPSDTESEESKVFLQDKAVYGFQPNFLLKGGATMETGLRGVGFRPEDNISVTLKGSRTQIEWDLGVNDKNDTEIGVTVPAGIAPDTYDAYITVNGKKAILKKGLSIYLQGSEKITDFGAYRFVSYQKRREGNRTYLEGNVLMNGWLAFNGAVELEGDLFGSSISLTDQSGSKIWYHKGQSKGLAATLAEQGRPVELPEIGRITLYNENSIKKEIISGRVDKIPLDGLRFGGFMFLHSVQAELQPTHLSFVASKMKFDFPMSKKILKNRFKWDPFSLDTSFGGSFSGKNIGIRADIEWGNSDAGGDTFYPFTLGKGPINISPQDIEVHIDTMKNDYEFKFKVKTMFVMGNNSLGLRVKWDNPDETDQAGKHSNGIVPTEINLYADIPITASVSGVPITFSDFMLGVKDIDTSESVLNWTLTGGCDISVAKISAIADLKGLTDWIGDVSLISLDDTTLSLSLGKIYLQGNTTVKLLGGMNMGEQEFEMGKFSYSSKLLNMDKEEVVGARFRGVYGPNWKIGDSRLKLQVAGEIDLMSRFLGLQGEGEIDADLKLWIISVGTSAKGNVAIGVRITSKGEVAFITRTDVGFGNLTFPNNMSGKL